MFNIYQDSDRMYAIINHDIDNKIEDVSAIIEIQYRFLQSNCKRLIFQFTECKYIDAAVSVVIGTLPAYANLNKKSVKYQFPNNESPILSFMKKVGMYKFYMKNEIDYTGDNVIPFNRIVDEKMMDEYADRVMTLAPIKMQKEAQDILSSYIYEIYQNGLFHSKSPIDVFTSGCWIPQRKEFHFAIYDMGTGIPQNIRNFMNRSDLDSEKCLKLAFLDGYTTSNNEGINRGLGLTRLKNFIRLNNGSMSMYTDDICYTISGNEIEKYQELTTPILGTLIIISIIADEDNIYIVEKERKHD